MSSQAFFAGMKAAMAAGFAAPLLLTAPAASQAIVIGRTLAVSCYEHALAGASGRSALAMCDEAISDLNTTRRDLGATHINRGIVRMQSGLLAEAEADFAEGERLAPSQAPAIAINRSALYVRMRRYEEAVAQADFAIANGGRPVGSAHFNRAVALEELGRLEEAYFAYRDALEARPGWALPQRELERFTAQSSG